MSVLVFAPHPDDDLLGCGGSILKHVGSGREVCVVYMTSGDAGSRTIDRDSLAKMRETEARRAAEILGISDLVFLRQADGYLRDSPDLSKTLIDLVRERRPQFVYLPHACDGHPDHEVTHTLVSKALGQAAGPWFQGTRGEPWTVPTVLAYEVWTPIQQVSYLEDITEVVDRLRAALRCHRSQLEKIDYEAMVFGLTNYRGVMLAPGRAAEAFLVLRAPTSSFVRKTAPEVERSPEGK